MQERSASVPRTARYYVLGGTDAPVEEAWVACHGYGQTASAFLRSFQSVATPSRLVIAPEGLSRFYVDGAHERIGASWMTREDREAEIEDYVRWLDTAYTDALTRTHTPKPERLVAFGFSQGCATVVRWLARSPILGAPPCDRLVLWGGTLPHDLDVAAHADWLREVGLTFVVGDEDAYVTPERVGEEEARLHEHGVPFETVRFRGGHRVEAAVLREVAQ